MGKGCSIQVWVGLFLAGFGGCYQAPELPIAEAVPFGSTFQPCAQPRQVRVGCVLDGDTFRVGTCDPSAPSVRLLGIDAPEIAHGGQPAECYGIEATNALARRIEGEQVLLEFDENCYDVYNRELAWVWILTEADGTMVADQLINEWLVEQGYAVRYGNSFHPSVIYQRRMDSAATYATLFNTGLWGVCTQTP